jgi:predicted RNA-binding protein (virulence factor B family)
MIEIGKFNKLIAQERKEPGYFLIDAEDEDRILLPNSAIPEDLKDGDEIEVFIYNDSEDRPIATTLVPKIVLNDFGVLEVKQTTNFGAFLDWGLSKDLLLPFKEQNRKVEEGEKVLVYLYLDEESDRLVATVKLSRYLIESPLLVSEGEEVDIIIWKRTDLGYKVVINETHQGLIYKDDAYVKLNIGDRMKATIDKIREDFKIDVRIREKGYAAISDEASKIVEALKSAGGSLPYHDKSKPEEIYSYFGISKKVFKKAIGGLYKNKMISISTEGIKLVKQDS